jgi:hypothetical protein
VSFYSLEDIIDAIAERLGTTIPTLRGGKPDVPRNTKTERFVWSEFKVSEDNRGAGASVKVPGEAKPIGNDGWECLVECRALSLRRAEYLRAGLITAIRQVTKRNYRVEESEIEPPNADEKGWVAHAKVTIFRPLLEMELPLTGEPARTEYVTITQVEPDLTGAISGDGVLEVGVP